MKKKKHTEKEKVPRTIGKEKSNKSYLLFAMLSLCVALTSLVYIPSLHNDFTNWDDPGYVFKNELLIRYDVKDFFSGKQLKAIFNKNNPIMLNYHPITILSLAKDYKKGWLREKISDEDIHLSAKPFHRSNLILHSITVMLVFLFTYSLSRKNVVVATVSALLFGIHPMHVESVAWISGRKDMLYTAFLFLSLLFYLQYIKHNRRVVIGLLLYLTVMGTFVLSLLSKAMAAFFPCMLILVDLFSGRITMRDVPVIGFFDSLIKKETDSKYVYTGFFSRWFLEKIPFIAISGYFLILAYNIQSHGAIAQTKIMPFMYHLLVGAYGWMMYIIKAVVPFKLSAFYPYYEFILNQQLPLPLWFILPLPLFVVLHLWMLLRAIKNQKPFDRIFFFGVFFYFFSLIMVLQIVSVGAAIMADRYSYLSYFGLFFIAGYSIDYLTKKNSPAVVWFAFVILISVYSFISLQRIAVWKNSETLWTDVIKKYPLQVPDSYKNRGNYYAIYLNDYDRALADYETLSVMINNKRHVGFSPNDLSKIFSNQGNIYALNFEKYQSEMNALLQQGKTAEAETKRLSAEKNFSLAHEAYDKGILHDSTFIDPYVNKAMLYMRAGNYLKGYEQLERANKAFPEKMKNNRNLYFYRGYKLFTEKNYLQAIDNFTVCLTLNSQDAESLFNLSVCYFYLNRIEEARRYALMAKEAGYPVSEDYLKRL